ncbi:gliding motility lipoprotein GldH [Flavobacteriales bacterium]|nr:gliding motility lipoprotein GldH [Flavobacteriales bacterium]
MRNFYLLILTISLVSCDNTVYENYYSFENESWNSDSLKSFDFEIRDTLATYNLSLNIRHSTDYEYQNLFVFVSGEVNDTIELMLADKNGKWKGSGISDVREFIHSLKKDRTFSKKGKYSINIEQAMRYGASEKIQNLPNILDVGLIIKKQDD